MNFGSSQRSPPARLIRQVLIVEVVTVKSVQTFIATCSDWLNESWSTDIEACRQNTPPDEAAAEYDEFLAAMNNTGVRWEELAHCEQQ